MNMLLPFLLVMNLMHGMILKPCSVLVMLNADDDGFDGNFYTFKKTFGRRIMAGTHRLHISLSSSTHGGLFERLPTMYWIMMRIRRATGMVLPSRSIPKRRKRNSMGMKRRILALWWRMVIFRPMKLGM